VGKKRKEIWIRWKQRGAKTGNTGNRGRKTESGMRWAV